MAAWASLSGYLYFKPTGGALSLLKSKKRLWCVLDENKGQLVYHKSEEDARCKPPLGYIELRTAAITLDLDNQNQFVIIVEGKETFLTAENHESMMIWLMALQAKRDHFAKYEKNDRGGETTTNGSSGLPAFLHPDISEPDLQRERSSSDVSVVREGGGGGSGGSNHRPLCSTKSLHTSTQPPTPERNNTALQLRRQQLLRLGESFDGGHPTKEMTGSMFRPFNRQLSVSMESSELLRQPPRQQPANGRLNLPSASHGTNVNLSLPVTSSARAPESSSSASTVDSDDVSGEEHAQSGRRHVRMAANQEADHAIDSQGSSLSASSDSAIDKGENSDLAVRVHELEKELINSKCELAKVLNRQSCYTEILKQKDEIILDLDEKLSKLGGQDMGYDSKKRTVQASREQQERIRILQNQNRFLNEEVRRLARLRSQEQARIRDQDGQVEELEGDIEVWKLQYVSLIQSSIRFTGTDTMDDAELSLYGGDRHKNKVKSLLDDGRKINPSLPTFENLAAGEVHVDSHGFKHQFHDQGLLLHYLCQELTQHYLSLAATHERHQQAWHQYMRTNAKNLLKNRQDLKELCRGGIPDHFRRTMWRSLIHDKVSDLIVEKGPHYFRSLCSMLPDSPLAARYRKQISLDLMRTMPSNIKFSTPGSKGIMDLQDVLLAFCVHNPNIGYCQGMNFLVAMALLFMDAQDAFWTLVAVTERYHSVSYFDQNLLGAQADQSVLRDLLGDLLPDLARHLEAIDIEISTVTLNWFLAIFFDAVPFPTLLRIWDCFLLEGPKVLFRFSLAILKLHEREIVHKTETISVMRHLKACARVTYDVDGLVELAFRGFKQFPRRQDISSKQTVYLKALKDKYRWRELQKLAFAERENLFLSLESETGDTPTFECCAVSSSGEVWVCYGHQTQCKVCVVDCKDGTMTDLSIKLSNRVMSLCAVPDAMLFGTLAWNIICFRESDRTQVWEQQLHDAVLSLCQFEDGSGCRVFAGLADGTVAVLENVSTETAFYDVMYIMIGQSPVTCLQVLDTNKLWCACGNTVSIIQASTLDAMDSFTVSSNPYDHILSLQPGLPGVWVSVRGSSILELWDPATLCCKMLYDTRAGRYPNLRKDDEVYFNKARITCILPMDYSVWVGTGEGNLITYDVFTHQGSKTPSDSSSFVGSYSDSFSAFIGSKEELHLATNVEDFDPVREAAVRVRQLYLSQKEAEEEQAQGSRVVLSTTSTLVHNSSESVGQHTSSDPNTTLTATQSASEEERQDGAEETADDTMTTRDSLQPDSFLTPPTGDESEGLTPTPSFCVEGTTPTPTATGLGTGIENGPAHEDENVTKDLTQLQAEESQLDSHKGGARGAEVLGSEEHLSSSVPAADGVPLPETVRARGSVKERATILSSPSSINGVSKFYIGDECQQKVQQAMRNGAIPAGRDTISDSKSKSEQSGGSFVAEKILNKSEPHTTKSARPSEEEDSNSPVIQETDKKQSVLPEMRGDRSEETTTEHSTASSGGSVIRQVWQAITNSHSNARSLQDTKKEDAQDAENSNMNEKQDADSSSKTMAGSRMTLRASIGSSFASSVDSRHSESDEVFQDATEDFVCTSAKDGSAASFISPASIEEESQYESGADDASSQYDTGQDDAMSRENSSRSLDKGSESVDDSGSGDGGRPPMRRKRPQSLFVNRGSTKTHHGSCVDRKGEKVVNRVTIIASPSSSQTALDSSSIQTMAAATTITNSKPITVTSSSSSFHRKVGRSNSSSSGASQSTTECNSSESSIADKLLPADPEAKYRLDYTNLHVDSVSDMDSVSEDAGMDSRRSSSVFSDVQNAGQKKTVEVQYDDSSEEGDGQLHSLNCDPSSFIFPQDYYGLQEGGEYVGRAMMDLSSTLLQTPAISTISCRTWSSYDEVSTPSRGDCESRSGRNTRVGSITGMGHLPRNNSQLSTTISIASTAELLYAADMTLMSKNKISEKPVKCLLLYQFEGKPLVLSFSGFHSDDEAVLKWSREKDEMLWTNDPILEYNPTTKTTKLPTYMRARLSSSSSTHSRQQRVSQGSQGSQ